MPTGKRPLNNRPWLSNYGRRWAGISTLLTAASWLALWLLWPSMAPPASGRRITATTIAQAAPSEWILAEPATVFASPWEQTQTRLAEGDTVPALAAFERRPGEPAALARQPVAIAWPKSSMLGSNGPAFRRPELKPPARMAFAAPEVDKDPPLALRLSDALNAKGFRLPDAAQKALEASENSGSLVLLVDIDVAGRPVAVFVEHSSGHRAFDMAAVHAVYQGQASSATTPYAGRVFISRPAR